MAPAHRTLFFFLLTLSHWIIAAFLSGLTVVVTLDPCTPAGATAEATPHSAFVSSLELPLLLLLPFYYVPLPPGTTRLDTCRVACNASVFCYFLFLSSLCSASGQAYCSHSETNPFLEGRTQTRIVGWKPKPTAPFCFRGVTDSRLALFQTPSFSPEPGLSSGIPAATFPELQLWSSNDLVILVGSWPSPKWRSWKRRADSI